MSSLSLGGLLTLVVCTREALNAVELASRSPGYRAGLNVNASFMPMPNAFCK
jgi:hypothetical protein